MFWTRACSGSHHDKKAQLKTALFYFARVSMLDLALGLIFSQLKPILLAGDFHVRNGPSKRS